MTDHDALSNLLRAAGAGGPMGALTTAMELPQLLGDLSDHLDVYDGDPEMAIGEGLGLTVWTEASGEARSALLLSLAWTSRAGALPKPPPSTADPEYFHGYGYAAEFHRYAREETDSEKFHGKGYPAMPLPGSAGALASSCGFDADDIEITYITALLLLAATRQAYAR
jgi:hypothetical protein